MPTRAASPLSAMLGHDQTHPRQVEHLARLLTDRLAIHQISTTATAEGRHVHDHPVGLLDTLKTMTLMATLPARLAPRPAPQTLGCRRLGQPLRRRRPRRITRVLRQPPLQLSDLDTQLSYQRRLLNDKRLQLPPRKPVAGHITTFETPPLCPPMT